MHPLAIGFELRLLFRGEDAKDLLAERLSSGRIRRAALGMLLVILLHDAPNLRPLLVGQVQVAEHVHHAAVMVMVPRHW